MDHITPRVNSALLGKFIGRSVRLVCKVERVRSLLSWMACSNLNFTYMIRFRLSFFGVQVKGMSAIVRSTDMGQVEVKMTTVRTSLFFFYRIY